MTQQDLAAALKSELGRGLSQSYLSQIESGRRPHLTNSSRMMLARFFKVHPGHLVDDPEDFHPELTSDLRAESDQLEAWLLEGAMQFARDPDLSDALFQLANFHDPRKCLLLLDAIIATPGLLERLSEVLAPQHASRDAHADSRRKARRGDR
jgi:transcriptional regulator with XRE-family HTH domain